MQLESRTLDSAHVLLIPSCDDDGTRHASVLPARLEDKESCNKEVANRLPHAIAIELQRTQELLENCQK